MKTNKTQINGLLCGKSVQYLNPNKDYSRLPKNTQNGFHVGSKLTDVLATWDKIKAENPDQLIIEIEGVLPPKVLLANWSVSGKSVTYTVGLSGEELVKFGVPPSRFGAYLTVQGANTIVVHNGKCAYIHVCPSLVKIL